MKIYSPLIICFIVSCVFWSCSEKDMIVSEIDSRANPFYPTTKPCTRWWWFATEIKKEDIKYQLDWAKEYNFGGVEIAWVYPLYRYQRMYERLYGRYYPKDTTAQKWLSPEWVDVVNYTKSYADTIGLACDFTFGSAWPVAASNLDSSYGVQVYGDSSFQQLLTFAWTWPDTQLVINHLDPKAFELFSEPIGEALEEALQGSKSALFTDSWEIKQNDKYKIWTKGFETRFKAQFGYDLIEYMELGIDSFPDVRYDYMLLVDEYVTEGFYKPYVEKCKKLGAWSRVQCLASPTDVMTTYGMVDIPETEAMLNNPGYSRIVSSSALLSQKPLVSCESFTCMYGFPATYLKEEQTADLKLVADALFAQGVNQHFYHGMPYNPMGSDTIEFFATTYFGPGGSLTPELKGFNRYIEKVCGYMQKGNTYSDVAVYIPYEDAVMKGALPKEKQRVWVWGEYELRYVDAPTELAGYHPIWINRHFLEKASFAQGKLQVGNARFNALYIDVAYLDLRALNKVLALAKEGLPVILKSNPQQPGKVKDADFKVKLQELRSLSNVRADLEALSKRKGIIGGEEIPPYWCRVDEQDNHYIFLAQAKSKDLVYPLYSGQSFMDKSDTLDLSFFVNDIYIEEQVVFQPYESKLIKISKNGKLEYLDINYTPKDPVVRPKEKQKMYF